MIRFFVCLGFLLFSPHHLRKWKYLLSTPISCCSSLWRWMTITFYFLWVFLRVLREPLFPCLAASERDGIKCIPRIFPSFPSLCAAGKLMTVIFFPFSCCVDLCRECPEGFGGVCLLVCFVACFDYLTVSGNAWIYSFLIILGSAKKCDGCFYLLGFVLVLFVLFWVCWCAWLWWFFFYFFVLFLFFCQYSVIL